MIQETEARGWFLGFHLVRSLRTEKSHPSDKKPNGVAQCKLEIFRLI